jgi:asparagine synthase (glutamine-hydrolysing)
MCGIFGMVMATACSDLVLRANVARGLQAIQHRGPDGQGVWISKSAIVGLGHVRLATIDLETGNQPMQTIDGRYTIVYNGEVYNYLELREELGRENFCTISDTEVILRAYARWGTECVTKLRGMFAFAIWDEHERKLFLARDRFGIKPLYWAQTNDCLFFGSEMKALLPFLDQRGVHRAALSDYFSFQFCLGEKTLLGGVQHLPAAHHATVMPGAAPQPKRY